MSLKVSLLKKIDSLAGAAAVRLLSAPQPKKEIPEIFKNILIIRPGGIGDAALLIPAVRALRQRFPAARITVLAERRNSAVFQLYPEIDCTLQYDHSSDLFKTIFGSYDLVIDTEQWHRLSAVVARLTSAPFSIGFATNERSRMFTHPVAYSNDDYELDSFFNLLAPLGLESFQTPERFLSLPATATAKALKLLEPIGKKQFVALFPGASIPERRWGADKFRLVAELLLAFKISTVVVGGEEDRESGNGIVAGGAGLNLAGMTSLAETAAVIDKSALLISGDSGVLHLAVGLDKPTVSLFGPGRAKKWAPRGESHIVINKGLPCSPCTTFGTTPPCRVDGQCMKEISVDEVFNAVAILLTSTGVLPSSCCKRDWIEVA